MKTFVEEAFMLDIVVSNSYTKTDRRVKDTWLWLWSDVASHLGTFDALLIEPIHVLRDLTVYLV